MARPTAPGNNNAMLIPPPPALPRQNRLWVASYVAIGVFALAMLVLTALLQWRELDTARSALEGDMHWAERTIETRLQGHQEFLAGLARDQEYRALDYELFQARTNRLMEDNPEIALILWVDTEGKAEWVAPFDATETYVGEPLTGERLAALQEALKQGRPGHSQPYADSRQHRSLDLLLPVQRGRSDIGAFVAVYSLDALLRQTLPIWFTAKYSLTLVDANGKGLLTNTTVPPADRNLSGQISLESLGNHLGLHVVAYRTGGNWLPYVPAALIVILTLLASTSLVLLRRYAQRGVETEEQLRAAYAFRQAMAQSMVTGLRAIDMEGRITFVNPAFSRMTGFAEEELLGIKPPYPYWPPEEFEHLQHNIDEALAGRAPASGYEMRIMRKSGERFDVRLYFSPLIDTRGRQLGWMASMNDITEPRRVRLELEEAHERFVTVIDGLDSAVHVADAASGEILFANRAFQNIFGFDAVGRNAWQVTACCQPPMESFHANPAALGAEQLPKELFDGEVQHALSGRWYHVHDRAIRWVDGRTVRVQIAADITEKKHIDEVNLQQQKRLEQTSRLITMGEMASSLAHELNQPLSAIANYSAGCIKRLQSGQFQLEDILGAMEKTRHQADRAGKIIRRMRDMVKKGDPNRQAVPLVEIVEDMRAFADIEARKNGTRIHVDIPEDLPAVFVDRIMIEQVLLNLVKNGIEAMQGMPPERRELTVAARRTETNQVEVVVSDHGPGLDEAEQERIFAPFYTTKPEGMGIGLAICRSIIEFHQGRLWVESRPEGGSLFKFTLPVEE